MAVCIADKETLNTLNKQEFRDAIMFRCGWEISDTPVFCACGTRNSVDHTLICKLGEYVSMRHNALRDTEAKIMQEVCRDVRIEPELITVESDFTDGTDAPRARLDISARGVWSPGERTFFDVRVFHPNSPSHIEKSFETLYKQNENEKKCKYGDRVRNVEKGTFTPLVFMTSGGSGNECDRLNKRLAELISIKKKEQYCHVVAHVRTRLRFALLKSTLTAIRGYRGKADSSQEASVGETSFNLIPQERCYEI